MAQLLSSIFALTTALHAVPAFGQSEQHPLKNAVEGTEHDIYPVSRAAEIKIFNNPKWPCASDRGQPSVEVEVPLNTCASANFTLDNNVHLVSPGLCPGGLKSPYISIYPSSSCTGIYSHPSWYDRRVALAGPGHCLSKAVWGNKIVPPGDQWSMKFPCDGIYDDEPMDFLEVTLPQPPTAAKQTLAPSRPNTASVSDSAYYISGIGMAGAPKFIF